jgi:membrane-associated phospholipid phosphatase
VTLLLRTEERLMWKLVGTGSARGEALPSRAGDVLKQPQVWAGFVAVLALSGPRGRRAALRGVACSAAASLIHLPLKHAVGRRRPRGARWNRQAPKTTSFPTGHTASDLSFMFGAAQELPLLLAPLSVATLGSHWSLVRTRKHYPSDVIGGGVIAVAVTAAAWKLCPPQRRTGGVSPGPHSGPARPGGW